MAATPEELKQALKSFRKRLNAIQREEDSKLGRGPIGHGKETITAIQLPPGFSAVIWEELLTLGYIKNDGRGFYCLGDKKP